MRRCLKGSMMLLIASLAWSTFAHAQSSQAQSDQPAGTNQGRARDLAKVPSATASLPFDPHDFSGVWMGRSNRPIYSLSEKPPAMTPWAQVRYDAAKPGIGPRSQPLGNDPIMTCDPIGYPRVAFSNAYPMEFVQTNDRLIEFFDFFYVHRTIYLDGRTLPSDPEPTWYGYSVGHWEGDTLVVQSAGFNDQSWLDIDGHPHSDQMRLEERFKRVDHDTIQASMTLTDPKAYLTPWVAGTTTWKLTPKRTMREDLCAPSDEAAYKKDMREPAAKKN